MVRVASPLSFGLAAALLLTGCDGRQDGAAGQEPIDPAVADALADPIMSDLDLVGQNQAGMSLAVTGPTSIGVPPIDRSDAAIAAARDAATDQAGGTLIAPHDPADEDLSALRAAVTPAQMALAARIPRPGCAARIEHSARWAALLPAALPLYPRAAVQEAAGTDAHGCGLRIVHFQTPGAIDDVLAFHHTRLRAAGYGVAHGADGDDHVLRAHRGNSRYLLYLRKAGDGLTRGDLTIAG